MATATSFSEERPIQLPAAVAGPTTKRTKAIRVPPKISLADLTPNNIGTLRKLNSVLFPVSYSDRFYKEVLAPEVEDYCKLAYYNDIPVGAICCRIERDQDQSSASGVSTSSQPTGRLYLMTLGVLAPYRRQGIARKLVSHVLTKASEASLAASLTPPVPVQPEVPAQPEKPTQSKAERKAEKKKGKQMAAAPEATKKEDTTEKPPPPPPAPILRSVFVHVQTENADAKEFWEKQDFKETEVIKDYYKKNVGGSRDAWLLEKAIDN